MVLLYCSLKHNAVKSSFGQSVPFPLYSICLSLVLYLLVCQSGIFPNIQIQTNIKVWFYLFLRAFLAFFFIFFWISDSERSEYNSKRESAPYTQLQSHHTTQTNNSLLSTWHPMYRPDGSILRLTTLSRLCRRNDPRNWHLTGPYGRTKWDNQTNWQKWHHTLSGFSIWLPLSIDVTKPDWGTSPGSSDCNRKITLYFNVVVRFGQPITSPFSVCLCFIRG